MSVAQVLRRPQPERIDLVLNELDQLPTLPVVAARVLQATTRDNSSAAEVIELISLDQSLSAKILSMVGKSSLGARGADTVDRAVVLLGFNAVRHAALSIKVFDTFDGLERDGKTAFDRSEFWKHSLAVACAAHLIAERWPGHVDPEVAFVCGLLHDIGKIALDACLPKSYARVVGVAISRHANIIDVEREYLGVDHTVAGKRLAQRWNLPAGVVECVWLHHHTPDMLPDSVSNPDLVHIVNVADVWVREQRIGFSGTLLDGSSSSEIARQMGMPADLLPSIAPLLLERIEERAEVIGLGALSSGAVFAQTVRDVNVELSRLNRELAEANHQLLSRSGCLDLIHRFNSAMHGRLTLLDICQVGAACFRELAGLPAAVVYAWAPRTTTGYAAVAGARGYKGEIVALAEPIESSLSYGTMVRHPTLMVAPPHLGPLRDRFTDWLGSGPLWLLPVSKDGALWGGVLFHAGQALIEKLDGALNELILFATVLAGALMNGFERQEADRLNEGLAEVNRQLKAAQSELLRARSLSMIAEMAAGAAHELNNPLAVISGRCDLLAGHLQDDRPQKDLDIIREQAHRCSDIVNELMAFAKPDRPRKQVLELPALLSELADDWIARSSLSAEHIDLQISDPHIRIEADAGQIKAMFEELLKNAFEACDPRDARLRINCHTDVSDELVIVVLEDNGCGMTPEILEKASDPFFSHRLAGRGRGLGLSRAARWSELNGGRLRIESSPGEGTRVRVEFPAV